MRVLKFKPEVSDYDQYLAVLFAAAKITKTGSPESCFSPLTVSVTFTMQATEWKRMRDKGQLGHMYNTDLSNYLSRRGLLDFYAVPVVDHADRARNGIKTIQVYFRKEDRRD